MDKLSKFHCRRYTGSVSAGEIRDFRGAMQGRADKGLFITTGKFSAPAIEEANRFRNFKKATRTVSILEKW